MQLIILLLACVVAATVAGGPVLYHCNIFCSKKYAEEIKANNMKKNDDLFKTVVECAEACVDQMNEEMRKRGMEHLVEPNTHIKLD